ncbi:VCBS domain-containing protein [Sphingomonas sp. SM33]|uniref:VCBS domain-containing protein n=1 Tax=Sphingomonas telluris TaxID=2907998 RepID=A0ABS9VNW3_9SPHN|nr:VCBS domain-containing protein [Sphingomonas telluris]MCH8616671.1 VCBS domain-containing protein [Sphingomonas telluris]
MATNTGGGTTASLNNTPQAQTDIYTGQTEDFVGIRIFDVMSNDLAGNAKILWSLDDGSSSTDLIAQDTARVEAMSGDKSANGAKIWITSDGKVGYDAGTLTAAFRAQLQTLNAGQTLPDTFTYAIRMSNGTLSWTTVTVVYSGANDGPVAQNDTNSTDTVIEAGVGPGNTPKPGDSSASGNVLTNDSDVDSNDTLHVSAVQGGSVGSSVAGTYGSVIIGADGAYTYTLDNNDVDTNKLAEGETKTDVFTYTVTDSHGASTTATLTITVTGTNDQPDLSAITSGTLTDTAGDDTFSAVSGTLSSTDVDNGDTRTFGIDGGVADNSLSGYDLSKTSAYGKLYVNSSTGAYTFIPNDGAIEGLKSDTSVGFTLTVTDGHAATDSETLTINITGANDTPTIGVITDASYTDTASDDNFSDITGAFTSADRDNGDTRVFSVPGQVSSAELGFDKQVVSTYGTLFFNSSSGAYKFVANDAAIEGLKNTDHVDFVVTVTDGSGANANDTLTITLNGANDTPELTASLTSATYNDTAGDDSFNSVSGNLSGTDRDGDTLSYSVAGQVADGSHAGFDKSVTNAFGTLYLNSSSGAYEFVPNEGAIEGLKTGATTSFTFTAGDGSATSPSQTLTINLNGVNDTPTIGTITDASYTDTAANDTFSDVTGTFTSADRDTGDTRVFSVPGQASSAELGFDKQVVSAYGTLYFNSSSGAYKFVANDTAIEGLKTTDHVDFVVTVTDGSGATANDTLTITLNGANDTPELTASLANATYNDTAGDDSFGAVNGTLSSTDRDAGDTKTYGITGGAADNTLAGYDVSKSSTYGTLYLNSTSGAYTFVPNDGGIEHLKSTESVGFSLTVTDGSGASDSKTLTINLNGVNDTPELAAIPSATYNDTAGDDTFANVTGALGGSDRDNDTLTYSVAGQGASVEPGFDKQVTNSFGTLYLNSTTGAYKFVPNDTAIEGLKSATTTSFSFTASDGTATSAPQTLTINLNGVNDTPELGTVTGASYTDTANDDTFGNVTGILTSSDRDTVDTKTFSIDGAVGTLESGFDQEYATAYGTLYLNGSTGAYKFVPNDGAIEGLKSTQHVDFTVRVTDGSLASDSDTLTITLNGANDTPEIGTITDASYTDTAADDSFSDITGTFTSTDRDSGDTRVFSVPGQTAVVGDPDYNQKVFSTYGTLYFNSTSGAYKFVANDAAIEGLKSTDHVDFVVTVTDGSSATDIDTLTITLNGVNDTPELSASLTSHTYVDTAADDTFSAVNGTLTSTDRDASDTATYGIDGGAADNSLAGYDVSKSSTYGKLYLNTSTGAYTFVPNDGAIEALKANASATFTLTVTDGSSATDSETLTINLTGANDTPELAAITAATYNDTAGDDTFLAHSGTLSGSDRDDTTLTYAVAGQGDDASQLGFDKSVTNSFGTLYLNSTSGAYKFVPNDTAIEGLKSATTTSFSFTASDGSATSAPETLTINLNGANDTPELGTVTGATYTDTSGDDTFVDTTGTLTATDRDTVDTKTFAIDGSSASSEFGFDRELATTYGTLYLNSTSGAYKFVPNDTAIEGLKTTDQVDFTVRVTDGSGAFDTDTLTITLNGVNDTPELTASTTAATLTDTAADDTFAAVNGTLSTVDRDAGDTAVYGITGGSPDNSLAGYNVSKTSAYGTLYLDSATGAYTFVPNDSAIEGLKADTSVGFTLTVTDGSSASDSETLTINITGANDNPELTASLTSATYTDTAADDTFTAANGTLSSTDRDTGDTATYGITGGGADNSLAGYNVSKTSAYGTLYLNSASGAYTFVPNDGAIEQLKTGTSLGFALTVTDASGGTDTETLTINLNGANDTPDLAAITAATYNDTAGDDTFADHTGTLGGSDRDGDSLTYAAAGQVNDASQVGYDKSVTNSFGTLYLNSTSGAYKFVPDDAAIEALKAGTTTSFTFTASDGTATSAPQTLTINLNGVNDTPLLAAIPSATYNDTPGDDTFLVHTGTLSASDRDGDTLTYSVAGQSASVEPGFDKQVSNAYGTLYLNSTSGAYKFVPDDAAIEILKAGTTTSFTLTASDGTASDSQTLTINLNGANDTPELAAITAATYNDTAADDAFADHTGTLSGSDRDGDTLTYAAAGQVNDATQLGFDKSVSNSYGTLYLNSTSGAYKFVPDDAAIEALKAGTTTSFTFTASDGSATSAPQTLTINLNGVNDTPVLAAITAATYNDTAGDDTFVNVTGTLAGTDRDNDALTYAATGQVNDNTQLGYDKSVANTYGTLYLNSTSGAYKFVPNDAAIEALKAGTSTSFTFTASDGTATSNSQTLTINLNGVSDTPQLAAITAATYNDTAADDTFVNVTGTLNGSDRDNDALTYSATGQVNDLTQAGFDKSVANTYGTLYLNSTSGAYKFVPNDGAIEALKAGTSTSFTFTASDGAATSNSQTLTINLNGVNDTPQLAAITAATYNDTAADDTFANVTGTLSGSDRDNDTLTYSATGQVSDLSQTGFDKSVSNAYGTLYLNSSSGAYKFVPNDAAIEGLQAATSTSFSFTANDGTANSAPQTLTINFNAVNDEPVVDLNGSATGGTGATLNYTAGSAAAVIAPAGIVTDRDSANFDTGSLNVAISGATAADTLTIFNQGTGAGQIGISGSNVTYGGVVIGTFSGGSGGTALQINFNASATQAAVSALVEDIRYSNATSGAATKTVTYSLVDGDGVANGGDDTGTATATINVTAGNQPPVPTNDVIWASNNTVVTLSSDVLLGNDTDTDGLALTLVSVSAPAGALGGSGNVTVNADGTFSFTTGAAGGTTSAPTVITLTYTESDGAGNTSTGTITLKVVTTDLNNADTIDLSQAVVGAYQASYISSLGGNDSLTDGSGLGTLIGGDNNDTLIGNAGNDLLIGGDNTDDLQGGAGNDILRGGIGNNDKMDGGAGTDLLDFSDGTTAITFTLDQTAGSHAIANATGGLGNGDTYQNMEGVIGTSQADTITGSSLNDILRGGGGNDTLDGGAGTGDLIDFSDGAAGITFALVQSSSNTVFNTGAANLGSDTYKNMEGVIGTNFSDSLTGSAGNDILQGGGGNDVINGGNGNDTITGGTGADQLTGGAGNDIFVFTSPLNNVDTITDFDANGVDKISLNSTAFSALGAAFDATEFAANAGGTAQDGNDFILYDTTTGNLYYDADGNGAGARILIATLTSPTGTVDHGDFLFGP